MKKSRKSSLLAGSLIIFLIVFSPYLLYIHKSVPSELEELKTFLGVIKGGHYKFVMNYIYFFFAKFVPLLLFMIWFLTNKHWWVHALIVPITVYVFQLINIVNDSEFYVDEIEFIYTVPIAVIVMVVLYFLRSKLAIYIQAVDLKKEMDENMKFPK